MPTPHPENPLTRPLKIVVGKQSIYLNWYSKTQAGRRFTLKLPLSEFADLVGMAQAGFSGTGPREFLLGFTPELLALHGIDAVPME